MKDASALLKASFLETATLGAGIQTKPNKHRRNSSLGSAPMVGVGELKSLATEVARKVRQHESTSSESVTCIGVTPQSRANETTPLLMTYEEWNRMSQNRTMPVAVTTEAREEGVNAANRPRPFSWFNRRMVFTTVGVFAAIGLGFTLGFYLFI